MSERALIGQKVREFCDDLWQRGDFWDFESSEYERARCKLVEALNLGLDTATEGRAHYVLGLVEYYLSDMKAAKREFELSVKTADPKYLGEQIWEWLEVTSRALGLQGEAENYRKLKVDVQPKPEVN